LSAAIDRNAQNPNFALKSSYASRTTSSGLTRLALAPTPPISEIASHPEFEPTEITKEEFEEIWHRATQDHLSDDA
jgi:hypothetical protein